MSMLAFDTMEAAKRLAREYDFSERQAEGITVVLRDSVVSDLATKEDLQALEERMTSRIEMAISDLRKEMDSRFREMDSRFREVDKRLHQIMVTMLAAIGVATAVISGVVTLLIAL